MSPELWVAAIALFVAGSAIGSAGTLLAQWLLRKVDGPHRPPLDVTEFRLLRGDVYELSRHVHNLDARLEFQERLLGGALTPSPPPDRIPTPPPEGRLDPEGPDAS